MASCSVEIFLCTSVSLWLLATACDVIVDAPAAGKIRGKTVPGKDGYRSYVVFRNIPYASPPVGDLRFAQPRPHPRFDGIFDACDSKMIKCIQRDGRGTRKGATEDCLILNVFAKNVNPDSPYKKVIVFIHGGAFRIGTSAFYQMGSFVANNDVIGVTINYRLGILGFLSTEDEASPGNYGLWDQALALDWVKRNIRAFGGDADDITISGESAGGASVAYLSLSPVSSHLFTKAILQSGSATSQFAEAINPKTHALLFAQDTNCWEGPATANLDLSQSRRLVSCLRDLDVKAFSSFTKFNSLVDTDFAPTVDGIFLPRRPGFLLKSEPYLNSINFYQKSYLVSMVNNEMSISKLMPEEQFERHGLRLHANLPSFAVSKRLDLNSYPPPPVFDHVMDFYTRRYVGEEATVRMVNDMQVLLPSYDFLQATSKREGGRSWFLYFDYYPAFLRRADVKGMAHLFDLLYWFDVAALDDEDSFVSKYNLQGDLGYEDLCLKSLYSSVLTGFMKEGDPGIALDHLLPTGWPRYGEKQSTYLNLNLRPSIRNNLESERRALWLEDVPKLLERGATVPETCPIQSPYLY